MLYYYNISKYDEFEFKEVEYFKKNNIKIKNIFNEKSVGKYYLITTQNVFYKLLYKKKDFTIFSEIEKLKNSNIKIISK
jgi:hypothetical protein